MSSIATSAKSSIGSKVVVAVTGIALLLFVIAHMLGNLQIFLGPDAFNSYAKTLKDMPGLLWAARIGLLVMFLVHVIVSSKLQWDNAAARPTPYVRRRFIKATFASRTMLATGILILAFVIFHLAHFTIGWVSPEEYVLRDPTSRHDVYSMAILGFRHPVVCGSYIVAMLILGLHLSHGASSIFQTLGLNHPKYNPIWSKVGPVLAAVLVAGYLAIPISVFVGLLTLPGGG